MACTFVNLHLHTETGSPLDGFSSSKDIIERSVELGYNSIAVTDHGSMSGILELYKEGKEKGIRVIPGIESYCVDDRTKLHVKGVPNFHLVLLAKNKEGYQNLLKLNFEAYKTGAAKSYMRTIPRVDLDLLKQYGKGVIASSACLIGQIPFLLREGKEKEADELADIYKSIFDDFYLEVQPSFLIGEDQKKGNNLIKEMSKRTGIPMIVTLDSHYARPEDRMYHQILLAIQSKKTIYDPDRLNFEATPLISEEEILKEFPMELVKNTRTIADQCDEAKYLDSGKGYKIPKFPVPTDDKEFETWKASRSDKQKDKTESQKYCRYKIELGWKEKLNKVVAIEEKLEYKARLDEELKVIEDMGFSDYFLIVADMLEECKKRGISRGAGRGSAGGSLLAFLMDITKVDPVKYDLLFSRFLNKDRISMPDIDSDICQSRRDEIKQYLVEKYGADKVAGIATFGTMKVRAAIKDVIRSLDLGKGKSESFKLADQISKSIPDEAPPDISFEDAYKLYPDFKNWCDTQSWQGITLGKLLQRFEGVTRQMGIHAAGVIISTEPLAETLPLIIQNDIVATAYDGPTLEKAGYLKLDVLGLRTLDVIDDTVKNVKMAYGKEVKGFPLGSLDFDPKDPQGEQKFAALFKAETNEAKKQAARAYRLYRAGQTSACFQVSGSGMQNLLRKVKPNSIEDVAAVLALFRPGPLGSGMTESYAMRKTGKEAVIYDHPDLKPVLESTYNVVTYQEQVMRMAMVIAGFTQSQADTLRKAVGKKIKKLMDEQESKFIEGGKARGYPDDLVKNLWQLIVKFAEYGFNKTLSIDTLVLTKEGQKKLLDIKVGEIVYAYDNDDEIIETKVCNIHDHGVQPCFEIEFEDGTIEECSLGHKFLTEFGMKPLYIIFAYNLGVKNAKSQIRRVSMSGLSGEDDWLQSIPNTQVTVCAKQRNSKKESNTIKDQESKAINMSGMWRDDREGYVTLEASTELCQTSRTSEVNQRRGYGSYSCRREFDKRMRDSEESNLSTNSSSSSSKTQQYDTKESECKSKNEVLDYCKKNFSTKRYSNREGQSTRQMERAKSRKDEGDYAKSSSYTQEIEDRSRDRYINLSSWISTKCSYRLWGQGLETSRLYEFRKENISGGRWSMALFASKRGDLFSTSQSQRSVIGGLGYKESMVFDSNLDGLFLQEQAKRRKNAGIPRSTEQSRNEDNSYRKIVSLKLKRYIQTLDLEVEHPEHNFILASGVVTSNSHSVAYALTSYKQTFLKANYLSAFWAAALTHEPDEDKRNTYLTEIRQTLRKPKEQQIHVLAVDINESGLEYKCVSPNAIRRNLLSLKGVGEAAVEEIIKNRPYKDFQDFLMKIDSKKINARVLKVLISAGAFDSLSQGKFTRKFLSYTYEALRTAVTKYKKKHSDLDGFTFDWDKAHTTAINDAVKENPQFEYGPPEWDAAQIRQDEEEIYGVAVSSHLFDDYPGMEAQIQRDYASRYITLDVDFERYEDRTPVVFIGILKTERKIDCKNGSVLRSYKIEDRYGSAELAVFENEYKLSPSVFKTGNIIIGQATISRKYGSGKKLTLSGGRGRSGVIRSISKV